MIVCRQIFSGRRFWISKYIWKLYDLLCIYFVRQTVFRYIFIFWISFLFSSITKVQHPWKCQAGTCFWIKFMSRPKYQTYSWSVSILLRSNNTLMPWLMFILYLTESFANFTAFKKLCYFIQFYWKYLSYLKVKLYVEDATKTTLPHNLCLKLALLHSTAYTWFVSGSRIAVLPWLCASSRDSLQP